MPTMTRISTSGDLPMGMNSGNMKDAMNSTEISGTPRISSTYTTHTLLMAGMLERRPNATATAIGKAMVMEMTVSMMVSGKPPH